MFDVKSSKMDKKVSVITVLYNSAGVIENLLNSICKTNKDGPIGEVVIVDNNSQDNGASLVEEYIANRKQYLNYEIKLIKNDKNLGFGKGNNIGVKFVTMPFILFSNPDIEFKEKVLGEMLDVLIKNPKIGLVGPRIYFDRLIMHISPILNPISFTLRNIAGDTKFGKLLGIKPVRSGEHGKVLQVIGAFMMARTNDFERVGGFDEENFLYMEELMLSEKLKKAGLKTVKLWTSQEIGHLISHSRSSARKIDLYRQAEEHYIKNYMRIITGNFVIDFLVRHTIRSAYKTRNNIIARFFYQRWLNFMARNVIHDPAVK